MRASSPRRQPPGRAPGPAGWWLACLLFLLVSPLLAQPAPPAAIPALDAPVVDTTGTLDAATVQRLDAQARALRQRKGSQLQVLVVASTGPESIEEYALRAFEAAKIGRGGVDDGVLLLVAKDDRAVRIETGYGLEGAIPDAVANRVIQEYLVPKFRAGDYAGGIEDASAVLAGLVEGEPLPAPVSRHVAREPGGNGRWLPALFVAYLVAQVMRGIFGRLPAAVRGPLVGAAAGGVAWLVAGAVLIGLAGAVIGLLVGMIGFGGGGFARRGGGGVWGGGGLGGGWGGTGTGGSWGGSGAGRGSSGRSGGSGGGGWSGGGGRSGGGGASGRW